MKGIGIKFVRTVDPYDVKASTETMRDALAFDGVAVVISKRPCPLLLKKNKALAGRTAAVDPG